MSPSLCAAEISASIAAAFGSTAVGVSVGLAFSSNRIESTVSAGLSNLDLVTTTDVDVEPDLAIEAIDNSAIRAEAAAASLAIAGGQTGVAVSGGGAFAFNSIQSDSFAFIENTDVTSDGDITVSADATGSIDAFVAAVAASAAFGQTGIGVALGAAVAINDIGYLGIRTDGDPLTWITSRQSAQVQARITDSVINTDGNLSVTADADQTINAIVAAGAVAIAGGQTGVAVAGSGVYAENNIGTDVSAIATGYLGTATLEADTMNFEATNQSQINSIAGAAAVSAAVGQVGVSVSVGVAIAHNLISSTVEAGFDHLDNVTTDGGDDNPDVLILASDSATINSFGAAANWAAAVVLVISTNRANGKCFVSQSRH